MIFSYLDFAAYAIYDSWLSINLDPSDGTTITPYVYTVNLTGSDKLWENYETELKQKKKTKQRNEMIRRGGNIFL